MVKKIAILGSTGSIGRQTLEVIESLGEQYKVVALAAGRNENLLGDQIRRFKPELAALSDENAAARLADKNRNSGCTFMGGTKGQLCAAVWPEADLVVMAQVGFSGFESLVAALKEGKTIALANKESLVIGGDILKRLGLLDRERILPVDSEHSAIWQCLGMEPANSVKIARVLLTASGGPFFGWKEEELEQVTPEQALHHPNWQMGNKITIDSATMMNKGLEVIEARWLFDLSLDQIEVVIHRQSIVHSMVEYIDGSIIAQMSTADMRLPIQHALTYPERKKSRVEKFVPFGKTLNFYRPDRKNFPCLDLAYRAIISGGTMPAALNGANEVAVAEFTGGRIKFTAIPKVIKQVMDEHEVKQDPGIDDVINADSCSRRRAAEIIDEQMGRMI